MDGRVPVLVSAVTALLVGFAQAQESYIAGDGTSVEHFSAEDFGTSPEAFPLDLPLRLDLPTVLDLPTSSYLDQVAMAPRIPGTLRIRYRGLQGVVVRYCTGRLGSLWRDSIDQSAGGGLWRDEAEARRLGRRERANALTDHANGGRWWERRWFHSLSPEQGGAPAKTQVHTVGSRIEIVRLGPLSINNEFKGRWRSGFLNLQLSAAPAGELDMKDRSPSSDGADLRQQRLGDGDDPSAPPTAADLWIGFEGTSVDAFGVSATFKVRPGVRCKLKSDGLRTDIRLKFLLELAYGAEKKEAIDIELLARCDPLAPSDSAPVDAGLELEITFLRW
jgi:hypothetical protein